MVIIVRSFRVYVCKKASWVSTTPRTWTRSSTTFTGWWRTSGPGRTSPTHRSSTTWAESSTPGRTLSAGIPNRPVPESPGSRPADPGWPPRPRCPRSGSTTTRPWSKCSCPRRFWSRMVFKCFFFNERLMIDATECLKKKSLRVWFLRMCSF